MLIEQQKLNKKNKKKIRAKDEVLRASKFQE